jgi:hypothetical protein
LVALRRRLRVLNYVWGGGARGGREWRSRDWNASTWGPSDWSRGDWRRPEWERGDRVRGEWRGSEWIGADWSRGEAAGRGEWRAPGGPDDRPWHRESSSRDRGFEQGRGGYGSGGHINTGWSTSGYGAGGYGPGYGAGSYGYGAWGRERGQHTGRGPRNYQRTDERIREDLCERFTEHGEIDASDLDVRVQNGEVTLSGSVTDRWAKRVAEDLAESVWGVKQVHNQIRVTQAEARTSEEREPRTGPQRGTWAA